MIRSHGAHGQPGSVDQAADVAVQLHVAQAGFLGLDFVRLFLGQVAEFEEVLVTEQGVLVEGDLRIQGEQFPFAGYDQRIDLRHAAVAVDEEPADFRQERPRRPHRGLVEAESVAELADLIRLQAECRVEVLADDLLGRLFGDLFNRHATFGGHDDDRLADFTIDHDAQVQLAGNVQALLDVERANLLAFFAGLNRHQRRVEHAGGVLAGFVGRLHEHDAGLLGMLLEAALAASTSVDLRLDHRDRCAEGFVRGGGFVGGFGHDALWGSELLPLQTVASPGIRESSCGRPVSDAVPNALREDAEFRGHDSERSGGMPPGRMVSAGWPGNRWAISQGLRSGAGARGVGVRRVWHRRDNEVRTCVPRPPAVRGGWPGQERDAPDGWHALKRNAAT